MPNVETLVIIALACLVVSLFGLTIFFDRRWRESENKREFQQIESDYWKSHVPFPPGEKLP